MTDAHGVTWQPDVAYKPGFYGYTGGQVASPDDTTNNLAATCRFGNFTYDFDTDNGDYEVTLVFGEPYFKGPGQRTFNVAINGQTVINDLDAGIEAGFLTTPPDLSRACHRGQNHGQLHRRQGRSDCQCDRSQAPCPRGMKIRLEETLYVNGKAVANN